MLGSVQGRGPFYYSSAAAVTPSDVGVIAPTLALWVGTTGNIRVNMLDGSDVTFNSVPSGTLMQLSVTRVWATNTTASNIRALRA